MSKAAFNELPKCSVAGDDLSNQIENARKGVFSNQGTTARGRAIVRIAVAHVVGVEVRLVVVKPVDVGRVHRLSPLKAGKECHCLNRALVPIDIGTTLANFSQRISGMANLNLPYITLLSTLFYHKNFQKKRRPSYS